MHPGSPQRSVVQALGAQEPQYPPDLPSAPPHWHGTALLPAPHPAPRTPRMDSSACAPPSDRSAAVTEPLNGSLGWKLILKWINNASKFLESRTSRPCGAWRGSQESLSGVTTTALGGRQGLARGEPGREKEKRQVDDSMIGPATLARRLQEHAEPKDQASQEG